MYVRMCVCMCICVCVHVRVSMCVYTYSHNKPREAGHNCIVSGSKSERFKPIVGWLMYMYYKLQPYCSGHVCGVYISSDVQFLLL